MGDEIRHCQDFAALQLVDKRSDRALAQRRVRRAHVEQIGVVGDDGADAGFLAVAVELFDLSLGVWFGSPLARGFGEDLNCVTIHLLAFEECIANAAGDGHVRA